MNEKEINKIYEYLKWISYPTEDTPDIKNVIDQFFLLTKDIQNQDIKLNPNVFKSNIDFLVVHKDAGYFLSYILDEEGRYLPECFLDNKQIFITLLNRNFPYRNSKSTNKNKLKFNTKQNRILDMFKGMFKISEVLHLLEEKGWTFGKDFNLTPFIPDISILNRGRYEKSKKISNEQGIDEYNYYIDIRIPINKELYSLSYINKHVTELIKKERKSINYCKKHRMDFINNNIDYLRSNNERKLWDKEIKPRNDLNQRDKLLLFVNRVIVIEKGFDRWIFDEQLLKLDKDQQDRYILQHFGISTEIEVLKKFKSYRIGGSKSIKNTKF